MPFQCAFTIRSDTRYLAPLRDWVAAVARIVGNEGFPKRAIIACSLALIEAVDNAIFHAHDNRKGLPIRVSLEVSDRRIVIEVADSGLGIGNPELPETDELVDHGRGLFIIRRMMAKVRSRVVEGGHRMRMEYRI